MIDEIKRLEPKPGRAFGDPPGPPAIPDVYVSAGRDGTWRVELNSQALPRVLVNDVYAAEIRRGAKRDEDKQYISAQLQSANWLTKSLEQRARTILNVATEIVRRQDTFLVEGVGGLRPLNLKMVGEAIGVHESTVSRATAHKFMQTPRGLFEMKYFFTASIASDSGPAHSAESVRQRIRRDHRGRGSPGCAFRRRHRGAPAKGRHSCGAPHGGEISRQSQDPVIRRKAEAEDRARSPVARAHQFFGCRAMNLFCLKEQMLIATIDIAETGS